MKHKRVAALPKCDFCNSRARYEAKTYRNMWAYMCDVHMKGFGIGIGAGRGKKLQIGRRERIAAGLSSLSRNRKPYRQRRQLKRKFEKPRKKTE